MLFYVSFHEYTTKIYKSTAAFIVFHSLHVSSIEYFTFSTLLLL